MDCRRKVDRARARLQQACWLNQPGAIARKLPHFMELQHFDLRDSRSYGGIDEPLVPLLSWDPASRLPSRAEDRSAVLDLGPM